jgi:hypothetical protein
VVKDLFKNKVNRTRVSELVYIFFTASLPIAILFLVRLDPPYLAFALVVLSKWRIFALRPRYWWANIKANAVDLVVGLSAVSLIYLSLPLLGLQIFLAFIYAIWLLVLKPRSGVHGIMLQAGIAQFVGLVALFHFSVVLNEALVLIGCWLIGYVAARHMISDHEEDHTEMLSAIWGLFMAEIGWLTYRWTSVYNLSLPLKIPQVALLGMVIGFCAARMYHANKSDAGLDRSLLKGTVVFGAALLIVILVFSPWDITV